MRLDVKDATFAYKGNEYVFEGLTFSVREGDLLSILGPNGCGKTTLVKCLCGMLDLKEGEILLNGKDIHSLKTIDIAKNIGYIAQEHDPTFPYTVLEVVLWVTSKVLGSKDSNKGKSS